MIRVTHYLRHPVPGFYSIERLYEDVRDNLPADMVVTVRQSRFLSRGVWGRVYDTIAAAFHQGDVNHVTGDVHFLTYFLDRRKTILTIHDCVTLDRLRGFKRWLFWLLWYWLPVRRCQKIVVNSEMTKTQVLKYVSCAPERLVVIHNPLSREFAPAPRRFAVERPVFLHIGTTANKNLERHVAALQGLAGELVVIGPLSTAQREILESRGVHYRNRVGLSRAELLEQYRQCDILLFASTYEGFGLPIIEAQAVGRPVVTSARWSMPEIAGGAALLVDPESVEEIRAAIRRLIDDAGLREELIRRGFENVRRFDVRTTAAKYAEVYRAVYAAARAGAR